MGGGGRPASGTDAKAGSLTRVGFGTAQGGAGRGGRAGCVEMGEAGRWGWDGCMWGSRGTVRLQAEVGVLLGQG